MRTARAASKWRKRGSFYDDVPSVEGGKPGDLVRAEPMTARMLGVPMDVRAWRVMYRSTSATGDPIIVSGVILVPNKPVPAGRQRPLLGFAPGTQGLAPKAACLSRQLGWGLEYEAVFFRLLVAEGWVLAVSDYAGLGSGGVHPYVVGRANGRAVLDIMRAARQLPEAGLENTGPAGIYGYSEGGSSAGWAAQLQPVYAPDVALDAVVVGSAPVELLELLDRHEGHLFAFLLLYAAIGFDSAYPELRLDDYLNPLGRRMAAILRRTHIVAAVPLGVLTPKKRSRYLRSDPLSQPDWLARIEENHLGYLAPSAPALVGGGGQDQVMSLRHAELLEQRWRTLGVDVRLHRVRFGEHLTAAPQFAKAGFAFLREHFDRHRTDATESFVS